MLKLSLVFLVGIVCGWLLLWQVQDTANNIENDCVMQSQKTGYDCKAEIQFAEFVYNVK